MKAALWSSVLAVVTMVTTQFGARADRVTSNTSAGQVEYQIEGAGPAILMIPSLGRGASDFDDLARRLVAAGFTAIRPEPRGIGKSTGPMNDITLHDLAADAAAVIEAVGSKPVTVIGHAFGQRVGRTLAADRPDLVKAMIMVAAGGKAPLKPAQRKRCSGVFVSINRSTSACKT